MSHIETAPPGKVFISITPKEDAVKNDIQFVNCLVVNTPKLWITAERKRRQADEREKERIRLKWSLLWPSSKSL